MGMDVHGINPKENKTFDEFPVLKEMESIKFEDKWKILDADKEKTAIYWKQKDEFDKAYEQYVSEEGETEQEILARGLLEEEQPTRSDGTRQEEDDPF